MDDELKERVKYLHNFLRRLPQAKAAKFIKVLTAVEIVVQAEIADSWSGSGRPEDAPEIEHNVSKARRNLLDVLDEVLS